MRCSNERFGGFDATELNSHVGAAVCGDTINRNFADAMQLVVGVSAEGSPWRHYLYDRGDCADGEVKKSVDEMGFSYNVDCRGSYYMDLRRNHSF